MSVSLAILRRAGSVGVLALMTWLPCESQFHLRPVTGVVTDKRGNTLPGAVVQLENMADLTVRSYITSKDGRYRFTGLNDDVDYVLKARYRNSRSEPKTLSKFNSSADPEVNLMIPIE